jgi:hypothetical protein
MTWSSVSAAKLYECPSFWKHVSFLITDFLCIFTGLLLGSENKKNTLGVNSASQGPKILSRSESSTVDSGTATSLPKAPTSPWMAFPMLFDAIRDKVPAKAMEVMNMHYLLFKSKKMTRADLVMKLRAIVGDALLRDTLTGLKRKIPSQPSSVIKMES